MEIVHCCFYQKHRMHAKRPRQTKHVNMRQLTPHLNNTDFPSRFWSCPLVSPLHWDGKEHPIFVNWRSLHIHFVILLTGYAPLCFKKWDACNQVSFRKQVKLFTCALPAGQENTKWNINPNEALLQSILLFKRARVSSNMSNGKSNVVAVELKTLEVKHVEQTCWEDNVW